ncbi:MAG: hypothetical protein WB524_22965 [Acidobacteriaceae bacterium]
MVRALASILALLLAGLDVTPMHAQKAKTGVPQGTSATKGVAKAKTPKPPAAIPLPAAHGGQPYSVFVPLPPSTFFGPPAFKLDAAPAWLHYETSTSTFRGTPDDTSSAQYTGITLTVSPQPGISGKPQTYTFALPVIVGSDTVYPPGYTAKPPALANKVASDHGTVLVQDAAVRLVSIPTPSVDVTTPMNSATTQINGRANPATLSVPAAAAAGAPANASPANYPLLAIETEDPVSKAHSLFPFTGAPAPPALPTVQVKGDGTFTVPLGTTLTEGERVRIVAIPPTGYAFDKPLIDDPELNAFGERAASEWANVPAAIIPLPSVNIDGTLSAGQSSISGSVPLNTLPPSPAAATAPDPKSGTLKSAGNLPYLAVEIDDPLTKLVSRTPLLVAGQPGSTSTQIQIGTDGTFVLPLKTALTSGQTVRIIAIPPIGYIFAPSPTAHCDFGTPPGLKKGPPLVGRDECVVLPTPTQPRLGVYTALTLTQPVITSKLGLNATSISGSATPSTTGTIGTTVLIGVARYPLGDPCRNGKPKAIVTSDQLEIEQDCPAPGMQPPKKPGHHGPHQPESATARTRSTELADLAIAASGSTPATTAKTVQTQSNGTFSLTLATPLLEEEKLRIVQILPPGTLFSDEYLALHTAYSPLLTVPAVADWGRVQADFAAGILFTNNSQLNSSDTSNFTQAHEFLDLTVEKGWTLPGCYLRYRDECLRENEASANHGPSEKHRGDYVPDESQNWWYRHHPGIISFFEGRLTAIPVATVDSAATSTSSSSNSNSTSATTTAAPSASASSLLSANLLTTAQTARFATGVYMPTLLQRWNWHGTPNALFLGPLSKVGFDSVTGPSTINVPAGTPGASSGGTVTLEPLYNSWGFGGRVGHMQLGGSESKSPNLTSYVDVSIGPYSNLQSYICKKTPADQVLVTTSVTSSTGTTTTTSTQFVSALGYPTITGYPGTSCAVDYPTYYAQTVPNGLTFVIPPSTTSGSTTVSYTDLMKYSFQPYDSRKRLYRLDFEGLLKIPAAPVYLGFNANLAQKTVGAVMLDHGYAAPDDLEIFLGTKFDIGAVFAKLGVNPF